MMGIFSCFQRKEAGPALEKAPGIVYCFWTGDNELPPNRLESLETMRKNIGVEVRLVTPETLPDYVLPDFPLHPGYRYLSLVHRSDYLRSYFMHHHGGGYGDLKRYSHDWNSAFERLNGSDEWALGYKEIGRRGVAQIGERRIDKRLKRNWRDLIGNGSFIFRPRTPMTTRWYDEVRRRMDGYLDDLKRNPGNIWGDNEGYPIPWTGIQGNLFHPLALEFRRHIIQDDSIKPSFDDYR